MFAQQFFSLGCESGPVRFAIQNDWLYAPSQQATSFVGLADRSQECINYRRFTLSHCPGQGVKHTHTNGVAGENRGADG